MADEEQTNFLRSILLLIEGGSFIARAILNRECTKSGRDIDSLLGDFKTKLKHDFHGKQYQKLFPDNDAKTDINCWDLQLLIGVISIVFRRSISKSEKKDLLVLKQLRNEVFMHCARASLDDDKYDEVIEQLEDSLNELASTFGQSVQEKCYTFIKNFKSGSLDALRPSIDTLNGFNQSARKIFTVGVSTVLAVDGPTNEWTDLCEQILETVLNNAITGSETDANENVRTKVVKMLAFLLENRDIVLTECRRACVILEFQCNSYDDLLFLLNKLDSWEYRYHLNKISNALTKDLKLNGLLSITSNVTTECLQSILIQSIKMLHEEEMSDDCLEISSHTNSEDKDGDKEEDTKESRTEHDSDGVLCLREDVRKPLKLGLECKSQKGVLQILDTFKRSELQVHLKDVADALSEQVQKKVTLKTSLKIEDFMSAFEEAVIAERYDERKLMNYISRADNSCIEVQHQLQETEVPVTEDIIEAIEQDTLQGLPAQKKTEYNILFRGIHPETCSGALASVIKETTGGISENENIIFNPTRTCAVVRVNLSQKPDLHNISQHIREQCIDDETPEVYEIPPADSIAVSTEDGIDNIECLEYYFESRKNGGYELKQDPYKTEDESCVILQFGDPAIVKEICARITPYFWEGKALRLSPCFEFEGEMIWDTDTHYPCLPKPVTVKLDSNVSKLLQRKCCQRLIAELKNNHCVPRFTEKGLEIACSLTTSMAGYKKLIERWGKTAEYVVDSYIKDNISERSFKTCEKEWREVMTYFQSGRFAENEEIEVVIDEIGFSILLLGLRQSVDEVYSKLVEKEAQLRQETEIIEMDVPKIRLMHSVGVFEEIKMEMVEIKLQESDFAITITGNARDIMKAKVKIFEICSRIVKRKLKHEFSKHCVDYFQGKLKEILTTRLKDRYTSNFLEWDIDFRDINVYTFEETTVACLPEKHQIDEEHNYAIKDAPTTPEEFIKESLWEIQEDMPISCDFGNMKTFLKQIYDTCEDKVVVQYIDSERKLIIAGLKKEAEMAHMKVKEFLGKKGTDVIERVVERNKGSVNFIKQLKKDQLHNLEKENAVNINIGEKSLIITGSEEGVMKTERAVVEMFDRVVCERLSVQKVGVKVALRDTEKQRQLSLVGETKRCYVQLPDEYEAQLATETSNEDIYSSDEFKGSVRSPLRFSKGASSENQLEMPMRRNDSFRTPNGIEVKLLKGVLGQQEGDVIVVGTSYNLNLRCGNACKSLLDQSGNTLQDTCKKNYPSGIQSNEIAVIKDCGNIACKQVYLTALPNWTSDSEKRNLFKFIMTKALEIASKEGMRSILFSALGTGQLNYPKDLVAFLMYDAVVAFDRCHPLTTLKEVRFVLYPKDVSTLKAFEEEERLRKENSGRRHMQYDLKVSETTIQVCVGDIANQNVDAILCSTSSTKDQTHMYITHKLYDQGGNTIEEKREPEFRHSLKVDDVAEIESEKLPYKAVYIASIKKETDDQLTKVKEVVKKVLYEATFKELTSLAIPASFKDDTGMEVHGDVCTALFDTVIEWAKDNPKSVLKSVKFVIDPTDSNASHRFRSYVLDSKGLGKRLHRNSHDMQYDPEIQTGLAKGKVNLRLQMGNILEQKTDAIVSSVGKDFQLIGSVAYALKTQCPDIERDIQRRDLVQKLNAENVVVTEVDHLKARSVIHIRFADNIKDWQDRIRKCLELANENSYRTVAFPVLGTGKGFKTFKPEEIAGCLLEAIKDFEQTHPRPSVQDVYLVVYEKQPEIYAQIKGMLHARSLEAEDEIIIDTKQISSRLKTLRQLSEKGAYSEKGHYMSAKLWKSLIKEKSSMEISIYSDESENITRCKKLLKDEIEELYVERKLGKHTETVKSLTLKEMKELNMFALADINIDHKSGIISVYGPKEDVHDVTRDIQTKLLKIEEMKPDLNDAEKLINHVQWQYEEVTTTGFSFIPYKSLFNYRIEQAYKANFKYFEFEENGESFLVDFEHLEEIRKSDTADRIRVMRKNILEENQIPTSRDWIKLSRGEVEASFRNHESYFQYMNIFDMNNISIVKISEISETRYHQLYQVRKRQMQENFPSSRKSTIVERDLWFAANNDEVSDILEHGFNNSLCGRVSPLHGDGVYFTTEAVHSIRRWLSSVCRSGKGYMFLANVLTGNVCQGQKGIRFPPEMDYRCQSDTVVDDPKDPKEFVVFDDTHACPRYLIMFQYTGDRK